MEPQRSVPRRYQPPPRPLPPPPRVRSWVVGSALLLLGAAVVARVWLNAPGEEAQALQAHRLAKQHSVKKKRQPVSPDGPSSPGLRLGFQDIDAACGDIAEANFLCVLNQGNEKAAGGARFVLTGSQATFHVQPEYDNGLNIRVDGSRRNFTIFLGPPKGKALLPGLYTGAERWPFNEGPAPGLDINIDYSGCNQSEGQFQVQEIIVVQNRVRRLVVDFDGGCLGTDRHTIGRFVYSDDPPRLVPEPEPPKTEQVTAGLRAPEGENFSPPAAYRGREIA